MASAAARRSRWSYGGRCRGMKCCGSENRAQACETHRRLPGPEGACATAAECKLIVENTIMRDSSWRQRSDDYEAAAHRAYGCASESHPDTSTAEH